MNIQGQVGCQNLYFEKFYYIKKKEKEKEKESKTFITLKIQLNCFAFLHVPVIGTC